MNYINFKLDDWQEEYIKIKKGNTVVLGGRQIGKSEIESEVEIEYLRNTPKAHLLIVSGVERQATGLYNKILTKLQARYPKEIVNKGKNKPLRTVFKLTNGAICRTEPLGVAGEGARQHTITRVIFEEMQAIPEDAFAAITPMLLTTGGDIKMLGTAKKTEGYVWERLQDENFKVFRIDAEEVAEKRPEPLRTIMLEYLARERKRLTEAQYAQEYKAIPQNQLRQLFEEIDIRECCVGQRLEYSPKMEMYGGSDIAALGEDETTFEFFDCQNEQRFVQIQNIVYRKKYPHEVAQLITEFDLKYNFKKYSIDDGGLGVGVLGLLLKDNRMAKKVVALNNSRRDLDRYGEGKATLTKENMYINLYTRMKNRKIILLNDIEIIESLRSVQFEIDERGKLIIFGNNTHIVEGIIRAIYLPSEKKHLKLWVHYN